jgi:hypothetical protein
MVKERCNNIYEAPLFYAVKEQSGDFRLPLVRKLLEEGRREL